MKISFPNSYFSIFSFFTITKSPFKKLSFDTSELLVYSIFIRINVNKKIKKMTQDDIVKEVKKLDYIFHCEKIN